MMEPEATPLETTNPHDHFLQVHSAGRELAHSDSAHPSDNASIHFDHFEATMGPETKPEAKLLDTTEPLLAHVTKHKPLPPGNIKCLLSPAANNVQKEKTPSNIPAK